MRLPIITVITFVFIIVPVSVHAQSDTGLPRSIVWGNDKIIDGSMDEWSALGGVGGHGTVDNEWYIYDTGHDYWNDPQGGDWDPPLSLLVVVDHPDLNQPMPVMSGLNLWGAYLCYEPYHDDFSVSVALDLPLASNLDISPEYIHTYNDLLPGMKVFYPIAFDCDGNGDSTTVNSHDYYPASGNGFNYIKDGLLVLDDHDMEVYRLLLSFGDDNFPALEDAATALLDGLIIEVWLESEFGVIKPPQAFIPGSLTKSGNALDLMATYGTGVLDVAGHVNPDPFSNPRIVDIEIKLSMLKIIIEDPTYIDWNKVPIGKFPVHDLRNIFCRVKSGSLDDSSGEHVVAGGLVFPELPFIAEVEKTVSCGNCSGGTTWPSESMFALRQSDLLFELNINVPKESSKGTPNVEGFIDVLEECIYLDENGVSFEIPQSEWELCEIYYNRVPGILTCPNFNLHGSSARLLEKSTSNDFLFMPEDEVKIVFAVYPNSTPMTEDFYMSSTDLAGLVYLETWTPTYHYEMSHPDDAEVDILKPDFQALKAVEFIDDNGIRVGPQTDLSESWWQANAPPGYKPAFPVTVSWYLAVLNENDHPVLLEGTLHDPFLQGLGSVSWILRPPPCDFILRPGEFFYTKASKTYDTYADFQADCNAGSEIHNSFFADANIMMYRPGIPDICWLKDGQPVPDYMMHEEALAVIYLRPGKD